MNNKLYRSTDQKMLAGVCGGLAEYFNIDVTLVRLIWAIVSIPSFGVGLLIYIIAAIIVPQRPYNQKQEFVEFVDTSQPLDKSKIMIILGAVLVIVGMVALIGGLFPFLWKLLKNVFWPSLIIIIGIGLIYSSWKNK
ncbi:MAG: PspC domain-containing protein [Clostridiales bacterium]|nr:PspC domain-containing protein [Clostridiales bacterium]